jgi:hypothetical protein
VTSKARTIGDFLRAMKALHPRDPTTIMAIQDMLGLTRPPPVAEPAKDLGPWKKLLPTRIPVHQKQPAGNVPERQAQSELDALHPRDPTTIMAIQDMLGLTRPAVIAEPVGAGPEPERQPQPESLDRIPAVLRLVREGTGRPDPPAWLTVPGEIVSSQPPIVSGPPTEPEPLFGGITRRAVLTAVFATDVPEGDLDLELIIELVSARRPIPDLPRWPVPTLRQGVQLLLDLGQGMDPYANDRDSLADCLSDILPNDRISILHFVGCPNRGCGSGPRDDWLPWQPLIRGTPVVAVTDLGIGAAPFDSERAQTSEWLAFASRLKAAGCPLAALVPYGADRWPPRLDRAMRLLHWSERATPRQMAHARRRRG